MRSTSPITNSFGEIKLQLADRLKPYGFEVNRRTCYRVTSPGIVQIINLQRPPAPPELFTVNLGIFIEEVGYSIYQAYQPLLPKQIQYGHCHVQARLGVLSGRKDFWWDLTMGAANVLADLDPLILNEGLNFLDRFTDIDRIFEGLIKSEGEKVAAYPRVSRVVAAAIFAQRGDIEGAVLMMKEEISRFPEGHPRPGIIHNLSEKFGLASRLAL